MNIALPFVSLLTALIWALSAHAASFKPIFLNPEYDHDHWGTSHTGIIKDFRAYRSNFDDLDDDDGFGGTDAWGVPEWVAYEIKRFDGACIETHARPSDWIHDDGLEEDGVMPTDDSYRFSQEFRAAHRDWFVRGHLATKLHAERLGASAAWNTHTFYNGIPQRQSFNSGIWLDLEDLTAAWAQRFGAVWVVTGPIFVDRYPHAHLGEDGEFPVAIPEALFKIVVKEGESSLSPDVLAFIYPQIAPGYDEAPYDHLRFLATVDEIEALTGLDFLTRLAEEQETQIEADLAAGLWPVGPEDFIQVCGNE